mgnify:CR=1 FL=1
MEGDIIRQVGQQQKAIKHGGGAGGLKKQVADGTTQGTHLVTLRRGVELEHIVVVPVLFIMLYKTLRKQLILCRLNWQKLKIIRTVYL